MKTKHLFFLAITGLVLAGCSSTQNTTATSDSDTMMNMPDTMTRDTMRMDTTKADTMMKDTTKPDSPQ